MPETEQAPRQPLRLTQDELDMLQTAELEIGKEYPKLKELGIAPGSGDVIIQVDNDIFSMSTNPDDYGTVTILNK